MRIVTLPLPGSPLSRRRPECSVARRKPRRRRHEDGTIPAPMRDEPAGTVTPGGRPAPLGARGAKSRAESLLGVAPPAALLVALVLALAGYAALAADVVNGGAFSELDVEVAEWVAESMPTWVEWLARPFTWLGGVVGMTLVVTGVSVILLRRGLRREAIVLIVVTLGSQALVLSAKAGYERERPDVGSAIALPSSFSFPSGHATTGVAVFGLLGLYAAALATTRATTDRGRRRGVRRRRAGRGQSGRAQRPLPRRRARRCLPRPRLALHVPPGRRVAALASSAGAGRLAATIAAMAVTDDRSVADQLLELGTQLAWVRDYL